MEYLPDTQLKVYFQDGSEIVVSVLGEEDGVYKCNALSKNEVYNEGDIVYVDPKENKVEKISIKKKSRIYEEDDEMFDEKGKTYEYHINLDERGEFNADVRDPDTDESIFEINSEILEKLVNDNMDMNSKEDVVGLEVYLKENGWMKEEDSIVKVAIKKKSQRFNWEFDKHQSQYIYNEKTGEIEKDEESVTN